MKSIARSRYGPHCQMCAAGLCGTCFDRPMIDRRLPMHTVHITETVTSDGHGTLHKTAMFTLCEHCDAYTPPVAAQEASP